MESKLLIIALAFSLAPLSSCDRYEYVHTDSYITGYVGISGIKLLSSSDEKDRIAVEAVLDYSERCDVLSEGGRQDDFRRLSEKHKDSGYSGDVCHRVSSPSLDDNERFAVNTDYTEMDITCDKAYDSTHQKGASLSDLVRFVGFTPYPYILSRYASEYDYKLADLSRNFMSNYFHYVSLSRESSPFYPVDKMMDSLTSDDLTLVRDNLNGLMGIGVLYFQSRPESIGTYAFTVTLSTDDGRTFSDTISISFK
jgi:hypothetical protein